MNITLYNHEAFVRYILYCVLFGVVSAIIHCEMSVIFCHSSICKCKDIGMLKNCLFELSRGRNKHQCIRDFLCLAIIATALLTVTFLTNSGIFRIMGVPLLLAGFALGMLIFKKIVITLMAFLFFIIKKIASLVCLPIVLLIRCLSRVFFRIVAAARNRIQRTRIVKYTKLRYKDLDRIKQTGLLENI